MVRKNQPYHRKLERYKVCMVNREDKRVERMKFNYHYILLLKFKEWKSASSFVLLVNVIYSSLFSLIWKKKKKKGVWKILSILFIFFFSPISLQSKNRKSHFLSPFAFSVFPHFSSQPNSVKIEWNSNKEFEEMETQREKKFDDNYKENN